MKLIPIELTNLIKDKKIKRISCLTDEYTEARLIKKYKDTYYEFDTGVFVVELEDGSLLTFSNSEWGFATYYKNLEELKKDEIN